MKPVSQTPTESVDYAALTAVYGSLLAATAYSARRREAIPRAELIPLSAATFALSKLIVHEKVETWLRQPFVEELPEGRARPRGRRMRYAVGELLNCTRCMGAWSALGIVALRLHAPPAGRTLTTVLAASAGNDFLQAGFSWVCSRADSKQAGAPAAARRRRPRRPGARPSPPLGELLEPPQPLAVAAVDQPVLQRVVQGRRRALDRHLGDRHLRPAVARLEVERHAGDAGGPRAGAQDQPARFRALRDAWWSPSP